MTMLESTISVLFCLLHAYLFFADATSISTTRVAVTVPVNPVKEGSILSMHCQVWNLEPGYKVAISRHGNQGLTWDKVIVIGDDARVFLAIRKMRDGSTVYFLSIMDIARSDDGEYSCKVVSMASTLIEVIAVDSATINIQYFPAENSPVCSPTESFATIAGNLIALNCTSEAARPTVTLEWSRTGDHIVPISREVVRRGVVYSQLLFRPTVEDTGAVFLCQVKSKLFPERIQSCHIGPITVIPSDSPADTMPRLPIQEPFATLSTDIQLYTDGAGNPRGAGTGLVEGGRGAGDSGVTAVQCEQVCSTWASSEYLHYWVIGTVTAGFLAFVFLIIVVTLVFKHRAFSLDNCSSATKTLDRNRELHQRQKDDVYANIEQQRFMGERPHFVDRSVYMALARREVQERNSNFPVLESKGSIFTPINDSSYNVQYDTSAK